jgi:hypothetical protein
MCDVKVSLTFTSPIPFLLPEEVEEEEEEELRIITKLPNSEQSY